MGETKHEKMGEPRLKGSPFAAIGLVSNHLGAGFRSRDRSTVWRAIIDYENFPDVLKAPLHDRRNPTSFPVCR